MGRCGDGNPLGTKNSSDCNDLSLAHITAIESAAVVVLLESFPELTHGLWLHFIDNDASLGSFVKGSSSSIVLNSLAAKVHSICTARRLCLYMQRVETGANPADPPSRGAQPPADPLRRGWDMCAAKYPYEWPVTPRLVV